MVDVSSVQIKPATPDDIPALNDLVNRSYRGEAAETSWSSEAGFMTGQRTDPAMLAELLANSAVTILLVRDGEALAGCVLLEQVQASVWYLGMLSIDPGRQNAGIGRGLLAEAEAFAQDHGATRLLMTVIQVRDTLIAWYGRRGYRLTGETQPFPYEDERFGRPLRDDLHFVVLEKALTPGASRPA